MFLPIFLTLSVSIYPQLLTRRKNTFATRILWNRELEVLPKLNFLLLLKLLLYTNNIKRQDYVYGKGEYSST